MTPALLVPVFLLFLAILFFVNASRQRKQSGLPDGRVIYSDTGAWDRVERPLYDSQTGLTGKPDYIVEQNGRQIPVEVKSSTAPAFPYEGHIYQLAAYCQLIEHTTGLRPPYGIIAYRDRSFAIDYTPDLEARLADVLADMRQYERRGMPSRSHEQPGRCARCGFRSLCDQRINID